MRDGEISKSDTLALVEAAISTGLTEQEVDSTFKSGFEAGLNSSDTESSVASVATVAQFLEEKDWPEPQSLESKTETIAYPIAALPDTIKQAVNEVQTFVKAPMAMVASSAIGALSLAVQSHIDVERASNLKSPTGLFLLTIADSGERKSTCDSFFIQTIRSYEQSQRQEAEPLLSAYEAERMAWDAKSNGVKDRIKLAQRNGRDTSNHEKSLHELMREKPEPPKVPRLVYADSTPEALGYSLAKTWPSGGVISAEAGTVFGSHGMSRESAMRNLSLLNQLWDGTPLSIDRRTTDSFTVSGARLTVALQIQEAALRNFLYNTGTLARGTGFMARFLIAWPESTQGTRLFEESPKDWPYLQVFNKKLISILEREPNFDENGILVPQLIGLSTEAKQKWIAFHNYVESELGSGGKFVDMKDVASKAADNAARLAGIFHVFEHGITSICEDCFSRAKQIINWHLHESKRFFGEIALPEEQLNMIRLDTWLIQHCLTTSTSYISSRYAQQYGPLRSKRELEPAISGLQELCRLQHQIEGKQRKIVINPKLLKM